MPTPSTAEFVLEKIKTFSLASSPRYFGSSKGRLGDTLTYDVSCYKVDIANVSDVSSDLVTALNDLRDQDDYLTLNFKGNLIKFVKLVDFSFEEGDFTKYGLINLSFERYSQAKTDEFEGEALYECFNQIVTDGGTRYQTYFEDFSEDFDFNESRDSTSCSYTLNIKLRAQAGDAAKLEAGSPTQPAGSSSRFGNTPLALAKEFARNIFSCPDRPSIATVSPVTRGLYEKNYKKTYSENYDLISNTCSFSENFRTTNIEEGAEGHPAHPYALVVSQRSFRDERGVVTLDENGSINGLGINNERERYTDALTGLALELENSKERLLEFYTGYISGSGDLPLATECDGEVKILSTNISKDPFNGTASYAVQTSNESKGQCVCSGFYRVEDTKNQDGAFYSGCDRTISIEGAGISITGDEDGANITYPKFENARDLLLTAGRASTSCISDDAVSLYEWYTNNYTPWCGVSGYSRRPISESWSYDKNEGTITVQLAYSSNPIYEFNGRGEDGPNSENWIKKYELKSDQTNSVTRFNAFEGLNFGTRPFNELDQVIQTMTGNHNTPQGLNETLSIVSVRAGDLSVAEPISPPPRLKSLITDRVEPDIFVKNADYIIQGANYTYTPLNDCILTYSVNYIASDLPSTPFSFAPEVTTTPPP